MKYILVALTWVFSFIVVPYLLIGFVTWEFNINKLFSSMVGSDRDFIIFLWLFFTVSTVPIFIKMLRGDD